ncbi:MAG: PEP-CTERM system histidine kinase PrsK [Burkholderiales bacterium]|nr:PEP-CTERM system histidine kinase PrsK [Burkholderiales bacterium]
MNTSPFSVATVGYGLVLATNVAYVGYLLRKRFLAGATDRASWLFVAAVTLTAAWGFAALTGEEAASPRWGRLATAFDLLRYGCWLAFLLSMLFPGSLTGLRRRPLAWAALGAWMIAGLALLANQLQRQGSDRAAVAGAMALAVVGLVLLEQVFRNQNADSSWNVKPVCIGLGFGFAFDVFLFSEAVMFARLDDDALAVRGAVHALSTPLLFVASQRYAFWIHRVQLSRSAVFYSATLLLIGLYLLFIAGVGYYVRYFGGTWGRALQLALLAAALLGLAVVVVSASLRARLRVFLGKHFFSYRFDYRQEWLRFTGTLSTPTAPNEVGGLVVRGLADMVECPGGSLWSQAFGAGDFVQSARWNMAPEDTKEPADSSMCQLLRNREWIINLEEFRSHPRRYGDLVLSLWIATHPTAWLLIPLLVGNEMIGFVVLAKPR